MSGFMFNFSNPTADHSLQDKTDDSVKDSVSCDTERQRFAAVQVHSLDDSVFNRLKAKAEASHITTYPIIKGNSPSLVLSYFDSDFVVHELSQTTVDESIRGNDLCSLIASSDLVSGVYEGGFKVWECAFDLIDYINENDKISINDKNVFEMGCGAGLPGVFCLLSGAKNVAFQDYNSEVVQYLTIPTVLLNTSTNPKSSSRSAFYSGDWGNVNTLLAETIGRHTLDLILSAETIYNLDAYDKLHDFLEAHLSPSGVALFAAKSYYFGVGGGVDSFTSYVNSRQIFSLSSVKEINSNVKREILEIRRLAK